MNKFNILVAVLVLICLGDAIYRSYEAYKRYTAPTVIYHEVSK